MQYASTVPFEGDTARAFDLANAALTSLGFRISSRSESSLELTGPGMTSTRQSALMGATRLRITRGSHDLSIEAELGGVQTMSRFVTLFPIGLSLFLCVLMLVQFSVLSDHRGGVVPVIAITGLTALPWLFLGPLMARHVHARTCRAIDALLNNMASAGNAA